MFKISSLWADDFRMNLKFVGGSVSCLVGGMNRWTWVNHFNSHSTASTTTFNIKSKTNIISRQRRKFFFADVKVISNPPRRAFASPNDWTWDEWKRRVIEAFMDHLKWNFDFFFVFWCALIIIAMFNWHCYWLISIFFVSDRDQIGDWSSNKN